MKDVILVSIVQLDVIHGGRVRHLWVNWDW